MGALLEEYLVIDILTHCTLHLNIHLKYHNSSDQSPEEPDLPASIPQFDGNASISTQDSETAGSSSYSYMVNKEKQTERLLNNASKPPITINSNNPKTIGGVVCATKVNVV